MKMNIRTAELARALYRVQGIADRKNNTPIHAHALLQASADGDLSVAATDGDVALSGSYTAVVEVPGRAALHARQLYEVAKSLPTEELTLQTTDNHWAEVIAGASRFRLVGMPPDDFPTLPGHADMQTFTVPSARLSQMIERTIFCVATDESRYNLSGIYCEADEGNLLRMVATDGHRLSLAESRFESPVHLDRGIIVPRKAFQELRRVLGDNDGGAEEVRIGFTAAAGVLKAGPVTLSMRLIDGQFPDYGQVVPKQTTRRAKLARSGLADALRRVALLAQGRAHGVRLEFTADHVHLTAEDPQYGEAHEEMTIDYEGEPITLGFNARYLLDVLALIPEQGVVFELTDDLSPTIIRPLEEDGFVSIVMPMRM